MRKSLLLLVLYALLSCGAAYAQNRLLPAKGERGKTGASQPLPVVQISGRVLRLAPGGLIYDRENRFLVHAQLPADADVLYERDQAGDIHRMYILTDIERSLLDAAGRR